MIQPMKKRPIRFSAAEQRLVDIIGLGPPMSTTDLIARFYDGPPPLNAGPIIVGMMRSIIRKSLAMPDLPYVARKSIRRGPRPIEFWLEPRS